MTVRFDTSPDLLRRWQPVVKHRYSMILLPLSRSLKHPRVTFAEVLENGAHRYRATFTARTLGGEALKVTGEHKDGRIAIDDAFARARREISRKRGRLSATTLS